MKIFLKLAARQLVVPAILVASILAQAEDFKGGRGGPQMSEEVKAAIDACIQEKNLSTPSEGQRPSKETMVALDACLKEKGYEMPKPPHRGGHHRRDNSNEQAGSESQSPSLEAGDTGTN